MLFFFTKENIQEIKNLEAKTPNDQEFGENLRHKFTNEKFILDNPNDEILGCKMRKLVKIF